jgi:hypothetical protein
LFGSTRSSHHARADAGRRAVFSAPPRQRGSVIIECEACEACTPVPFVEVPLMLVPSLWIPMRKYSRLMRCPACHEASWCRIHWREALR